MDAVVLAGGYATRLWPITRHRPKMFLPIGSSTVVDRILGALEDEPRIEEVYVSTNERFAPDFEAHLAEASYEKPSLSVEDTTAESDKLGVVGALAQLVERESIEDDLLVIAGDNLMSLGVSEFLDFFEEKAAPVLAAYDVGSTERAREYGLVELDGDRVVSFQEKPEDPRSTLVSIACYAFPADALSLLERYLRADNNPDEPGWFVQWLQDRENTYAYAFEGAWFDIGTPESYLDAVAWNLQGDSLVAESATLENATIGSNVHVMADATVVDSHVDHSVIFSDATVRNADIRRSIIDEDTHLEDLDLAGALIGAHTTITNG